jgi:hypothetical protein
VRRRAPSHSGQRGSLNRPPLVTSKSAKDERGAAMAERPGENAGRVRRRWRGTPLPVWTTWLVLSLLTAGVVFLGLGEDWPFDAELPDFGDSPSVWQLLLGDGIVLGAVRFVILVAAIYLACALVVFAINNIWPKEIGPASMQENALHQGAAAIRGLEDRLRASKAENEQIRQELRELKEKASLVDSETRPEKE